MRCCAERLDTLVTRYPSAIKLDVKCDWDSPSTTDDGTFATACQVRKYPLSSPVPRRHSVLVVSVPSTS